MPNFGVWNRVIFFSQEILNQNCILHRTILVLCCNLSIKSHNYQINKVPKTAQNSQKGAKMAKQRQKYQILSKSLLNNLEMMPKTVEKKIGWKKFVNSKQKDFSFSV